MDQKLREEKLNMWKKQLKELEEELKATLLLKGKAAAEGDLSENAAYKDAVENAEMVSARIASVQKMIVQMEKEG